MVREQLERAGVLDVMDEDVDTTIDDRYFSHSRGDMDERFAVVASLKRVAETEMA